MTRQTGWSLAGWIQTLKHPSGKGGQWHHPASGWWLTHCGHPTAIYPYALHSPDAGQNVCVMSHNGMGWQKLAVAVEVHRRILLGELVVTDDRCTAGTLRVPSITAGGTDLPAERRTVSP